MSLPENSSYRAAPGAKFKPGDAVVIDTRSSTGHCRTPIYVRGKKGIIERICGPFANPETLAYAKDGLPEQVLYRVRFSQSEIWAEYKGPPSDELEIEIYEHWLKPA